MLQQYTASTSLSPAEGSRLIGLYYELWIGAARLRYDPGRSNRRSVSRRMGLLNKAAYPYWKVAALATANPAYIQGPTQGCGYVGALCSKRTSKDQGLAATPQLVGNEGDCTCSCKSPVMVGLLAAG